MSPAFGRSQEMLLKRASPSTYCVIGVVPIAMPDISNNCAIGDVKSLYSKWKGSWQKDIVDPRRAKAISTCRAGAFRMKGVDAEK
eukprot:16431424-Heterocapsa_arctica.AAC.1